MSKVQPRLVRFSAENYKRIHYVELTFDENDNLVEVTGEYANGKSCLLEGFEVVLTGKQAVTGNPVRNGQKSTHLEADIKNCELLDGVIDDIRIKRIIGKGEKLLITKSDGSDVKRPGDLLKSFRSKMINPFDLFNLKSNEDFYKAMLPTVDLDIDLDKLEIERKRIYDDRTRINQNVNRLKGHLQQLKDVEELPDDLPDKEVLVSDLSIELECRHEVNRKNFQYLQLLENKGLEGDRAIADVDRLTKELERANIKLETITADYTALEATGSETPNEDTDEIQVQISTAEETNRLVRHRDTINQASGEFDEEKKKSKNCDRDIRKIDSTKADALTRVTFPVKGMSFDDGVVTLNGQPIIGGASEGERLDACIKIAIGKSHELPFVIVPSGSGLGKPLLKQLAETAQKHNCTVLIERLDTSGEVGIYLEDGEIIKDNR